MPDASPEPPPEGEPPPFDLAERTRMATALREVQTRLEVALSAGEIATWTFDIANDRVVADANLARLFSVDPEAAAGGRLEVYLQAIHHDDREQVTQAVQEAIQTGDRYETEYRVLLEDGAIRWLVARGKVERDETGQAIALPGVVVDITEQKRAGEALRANEEYLRRVIESSPDCIKTLSLDGYVLSVSQGGMQLMEVDNLNQVCGAEWSTFWSNADEQEALLAALETARQGGIGRFQGFCPTMKGTPKWWDVAITPILDAEGKPEQLLGVSRDITERKQAEQELAELVRREHLINEIGQAIRTAISPNEVMEKATALLGEALDLDRCYFAQNDPAHGIVRVGRDWHRPHLPSMMREYTFDSLSALYKEMYVSGERTLVYNDVREMPFSPAALEQLEAFGLRSFLGVSLLDSSGNRMASLRAAMSEGPRVWTSEEVALVEAVATLVSSAVEAARTQQRERNIAVQLQQALLPPVPTVLPGMTLGLHYQSAMEEAGVGGDFYDVYAVEKGCTALVIGDLSGKGLAAASQVATMRNMLRYALYKGRTVAEAITEVNDILVEQNLIDGFATVFLGAYDHNQRTLTYVNCGQEPGLVFRAATGEVEELTSTGSVLGSFNSGAFTERVIPLLAGDVLAVFTDGLTDIGPNRNSLLEIDGIKRFLKDCCLRDGFAGQDASSLIVRFMADVNAFAQGSVRDDICLLLGIVTGAGEEDWESRTARTTQPVLPYSPMVATG